MRPWRSTDPGPVRLCHHQKPRGGALRRSRCLMGTMGWSSVVREGELRRRECRTVPTRYEYVPTNDEGRGLVR